MDWQKFSHGLSQNKPSEYINSLRETGELEAFLPEIEALFGVPQREEYHPEVDTGIHTLMVLDRAAQLSDDVAVRYAALVHDLGKGLTDPEKWPAHHDHEKTGIEPVIEVSERLGVPEDIRDFAASVTRYHLQAHNSHELRPGKLVDLFENTGAFENPDRLEQFITAVQADSQGRLGLEDRPYPQGDYLRATFEVAHKVQDDQTSEDALKTKRTQAVADWKREQSEEFEM